MHPSDDATSPPEVDPPAAAATGPPVKNRRFRFSLLTLLLATAVVCLAVSHFRTSRQLHRARSELQRLRNEAGYLHVSDPAKIHVVGVPTYQDMLWKWRVYLPKERRYQLHMTFNNIPFQGFPSARNTSSLNEGQEFLLVLSIYRDYRGQWRVKETVDRDGGSSQATTGIGEKDAAWLVEHPGYSSQGVIDDAAFEPDEPVVLLRMQVHERLPGGGRKAPDPSQGVMLWIAPVK